MAARQNLKQSAQSRKEIMDAFQGTAPGVKEPVTLPVSDPGVVGRGMRALLRKPLALPTRSAVKKAEKASLPRSRR